MSAFTAKCPCNLCGQHIEFPVELSGTNHTCPSCGAETLLYHKHTVPPRPGRPKWFWPIIASATLVTLVVIYGGYKLIAASGKFTSEDAIFTGSGIIGIVIAAVVAALVVIISILWLLLPLIVYQGFNTTKIQLTAIERRLQDIEQHAQRPPDH